MALITKRKVLDGVYLVLVPEAGIKLLCGCPADAIKHLSAKGFLPIVEKEGIKFESGPNAILLSDTLIQNGKLANLSEFPVLHMFYNQGMILPGHPNSSETPILIGNKDQVDAQMSYIFVGNYGLINTEDFEKVGESAEFAKEYIHMKLSFAQGRFIPTDELMKGFYLDDSHVEIKKDLSVKRIEPNVFEIRYKNKSVTVNLNLKKKQKYGPTYKLPKVNISKHHFAIVHSGEGDGWDSTRPCLSSVIMYDGQYFLMDAGPNILSTLRALGLKARDISGVFFTHVHDDHFGGLYSLRNEHSKIRVFATNTVMATIVHKLETLLFKPIDQLSNNFVFHELERDKWNNFEGLEIQPKPSAHPIDTTFYLFRAKDKNGYKSYGHYCDIAAIDWLRKMGTSSNASLQLSPKYIESVKESLEIVVDVKKIDVGGPAVHGDIEDFVNDKSGRLVMGHTHAPFTKRQLEIGEEVEFGEIDVLIDKKPS